MELLAALRNLRTGERIRLTFKPMTDPGIIKEIKLIHEVLPIVLDGDIEETYDYLANPGRRKDSRLTITLELELGFSQPKRLRVTLGDSVEEFEVLSGG